MSVTAIKRFKGALLGMATGDALGACTQNMLPSGIRGRFGSLLGSFPEKPVKNLQTDGKYNYTWDTRIALGVACSLMDSGCLSRQDLAKRLVGWSMETYCNVPLPITYMRAARLARHNFEESINTGQPSLCSTGAARAVPAALFFNGITQKSIKAAITITDLTHSTNEAHAASVSIAVFISFLLKEIEPLAAFEATCKTLQNTFPMFCNEILVPVKEYCNLDDEAAFNCMGMKNDLTHVVPTAFYCFLKHSDDFSKAVCCAVNRGGSSNTTASITGAMAGVHLGSDSIPLEWRKAILRSEEIERIADKLYENTRPAL